MARPGRKRGEPTRNVAGEPQSAAARRTIVDATIATLAESGYAATTARAVAARAGVAPGGIYYHFGSIDQLLAAVFDACNAGRLERLGAAIPDDPLQVPAALAAAAKAEFAHPSSQALVEIVIGAVSSPELSAHVRAGIETDIEFTSRAIAGVLQRSPVGALLPMEIVAEFASSAFFGLEVMHRVGHTVDLDAMARLADLLMAFLAAVPAPAPAPQAGAPPPTT